MTARARQCGGQASDPGGGIDFTGFVAALRPGGRNAAGKLPRSISPLHPTPRQNIGVESMKPKESAHSVFAPPLVILTHSSHFYPLAYSLPHNIFSLHLPASSHPQNLLSPRHAVRQLVLSFVIHPSPPSSLHFPPILYSPSVIHPSSFHLSHLRYPFSLESFPFIPLLGCSLFPCPMSCAISDFESFRLA